MLQHQASVLEPGICHRACCWDVCGTAAQQSRLDLVSEPQPTREVRSSTVNVSVCVAVVILNHYIIMPRHVATSATQLPQSNNHGISTASWCPVTRTKALCSVMHGLRG